MENPPQNKMGVVPVKKLMLAMGLPMIASMALQAFYNIVDSYFVSRMPDTAGLSGLGEYGMNALTLAFPVQMLMIAIGVGTGVGINALLSRSLGQGNRQKASQIAGNAIFLGLCTYAVFLLVGLFGVKAYLRSQTADPVVLQMGAEYLGICTTLSFGAILSMIYEKLLQGTGRTIPSTIAQLAGAAINMALDPILIFGWLGCPALGVRGAAYATVIGQVATLVISAAFHHTHTQDLDVGLAYLKPSRAVIREIYQIGLPAIVMQALMSFMTYGVNIIFGQISSAVVTAYGVYYKIQQFVFFAAFGMNNALIPIIGFNYGRKDKRRAREGVKYGMIYTLVIMAAGAVLLQVFAGRLMGAFALAEGTIRLCVTAVRIITLGYLFAGANIAFQGIFQAFGSGMRSLVVSLLRLIIIALPVALLFAALQNAENIVWWAFPIAEACSLVVAVFLMRGIAKEKIATLGSDSLRAAAV
ncbi:MAG: MATE family efflux transporter [Oscillospiraceae bacterium]|jgi:putative MATE family efflux protein|nr:MATE family efflux transporter [Oscillospiraceae bacterium]